MPADGIGDAWPFLGAADSDTYLRPKCGEGLWLRWQTARRTGPVANVEHLHDLADTVGVTKEWRFLKLAAYRGGHATGVSAELRGTLTLGLAVVVGLTRYRFARLVAPVDAPTAPRERLGWLGDSFTAHRAELFDPYLAVEIALDWLVLGTVDDRYELRSVADRTSR